MPRRYGYVWVRDDAPTSVYRLFADDGALLYVGMSQWPHWRMEQHREKAWWPEVADWSVTEYPTRGDAATAEIEAIRSERPRYNGAHNENNPDRQPSRFRPWVRPRGTCRHCGTVRAYSPPPSYFDRPPSLQFHKCGADRCPGVGKPPVEWQATA